VVAQRKREAEEEGEFKMNNLTKKLTTVGTGIILTITSCQKENNKQNQTKPEKSNITRTIKVSHCDNFYDIDCESMCYNGMLNNETFSVSAYSTSAVNQYYPASTKEFEFNSNGRIDTYKVEELTAESITLTRLINSKP
jgi:hypothetical protein